MIHLLLVTIALAGPDMRLEDGVLIIDGIRLADEVLEPVRATPTGWLFVRRAVPGPATEIVRHGAGGTEVLVNRRAALSRASLSDDGTLLAFVSGETGLASVWVHELATGREVQLTNRDLHRTSGQAPVGFVPPPPDPPTVTRSAVSWTRRDGEVVTVSMPEVW